MKRLLPVLAVAVACGCTYVGHTPLPSANEGAWADARDAWTSKAKLYDVLNDVAFATATYQSPEVREQRVERIALWKGMLPAEKDAALARERAEGAEGEDFFLAFFCDERRANDLATDRGTWRVALVVVGKEQALASKVSLVKRDPTIQALYPYVTEFDTLYRVRFPKHPGPRPLHELPFELRIAGALGKLDLAYAPPRPRP
jgi:hypothetical protein